MPFILNITDFSREENMPKGYSILVQQILTEGQANAFLQLQKLAVDEISQEINTLTKLGLMTNSIYRAKNLLICTIYENEVLIGYGYSYEDNEKHTIYIDTIYILKAYRRLNLSVQIINRLIENNISISASLRKIKAVTQTENEAAIKLLTNTGFKYIET